MRSERGDIHHRLPGTLRTTPTGQREAACTYTTSELGMTRANEGTLNQQRHVLPTHRLLMKLEELYFFNSN